MLSMKRFTSSLFIVALAFQSHASILIPELPKARFTFRYPIADGLCNQHYEQITGLLLAIHMECDAVVIPPAYARDAFMDDHRKVTWTPSPQSLLWDMRHIEELVVQQHNMSMITADMLQRHELLHNPATPDGAIAEQVVWLSELNSNKTNLATWVTHAKDTIRLHVHKHKNLLRGIQQQHGVVDLYLTLRLPAMLGVELRDVPNAVQVARHVDFAPQLYVIANAIVRRIRRQHNAPVFNGAHLRIERDASTWHEFFQPGGIDRVWSLYSEAAQHQGFNTSIPVYVASGVYEMKDNEAIEQINAWGAVHASTIVHRGMLLRPQHEESKLHSEQLAAVDLLVLVQAQGVVGFSYSSFSWYLAELRAMQGLDRNRMSVVHVNGTVASWREPGATFDV